MRKTIQFCTLCMFVAISYCGQAQNSDFAPGYYLTPAGDTLKGYVFLGGDNARTAFRFKKQRSDQNTEVVSFDSCRSVTSGEVSFLSLPVRRSMTHIDKIDFTIKLSDSSITATIPMKLLYRGIPFSLYHYEDVRDHFFIYDGTTVQELMVQYRYLTQWEKQNYIYRQIPAYHMEPVFRQQIIALANNKLTRKQMNLLEHTDYDERSLVKLFAALDGLRR